MHATSLAPRPRLLRGPDPAPRHRGTRPTAARYRAKAALEEIIVTATMLERTLERCRPPSASSPRTTSSSARQQLALDEALGRVPGLFMQNRYNFAQDLRVSIRGFGARAQFGIRGIKVLVDGIPETLPDGQGSRRQHRSRCDEPDRSHPRTELVAVRQRVRRRHQLDLRGRRFRALCASAHGGRRLRLPEVAGQDRRRRPTG